MIPNSPALVAVFPGTFDPVTCGHIDLIDRACGLFDRVVVAVMTNTTKHTVFSPAERVNLITSSLSRPSPVEVISAPDTLLVEVCRELGNTVIVKGIRSLTDWAYEQSMAEMNRHLAEVETLFLPAAATHAHVSSSLVKEIGRLRGNVIGLIPDPIVQQVQAKLASGQ